VKNIFILISIFLLILKSVFGQITLDSTDFAPIGQNFIMAVDIFKPKEKIKLEYFGTDKWNFTELQKDDYDTIRHLKPEKTRYGGYFDSATYARYFGYTEIEYYHLSKERLVKVGVIGDYLDLGAPALVPFQEHILKYEFPLKFGDSYADTVQEKFKTAYSLVEGIDSIRADVFLIENTEFDAFGTVTTSMGTFETLREKNTQKKKIKAYQHTMFGWTPAPKYDKEFVQITYSWYAKGEEIPIVIAEVNNNGYVTKIKYKFSEDMVLSFDTKHVNCRGGKNGTINLTVNGGIPDYTYVWTNGSTDEDLKNLMSGTYSVTVTDNKGKTATGGFSVSEPQDSLFMNSKVTPISCYTKHDGILSVAPSGGLAPYFVIWSNDSVGTSIRNLFEGYYGVIVRDANRCFIWDTLQIVAPKNPISITIEDTKTRCFEGNDGTLQAFPDGGTPPYKYLWSNNDTAKIAQNLSAGEYKLIVTDSHGCTKERISNVLQPPTPIEIVLTPHEVNCRNGKDGWISTNVKGGITPYLYLWSNDLVNKDIEKLKAGSYTLTVTDDYGCVVSKTAQISEPEDSLVIEYEKTDIDCFNERNGSIKLKVKGGTPDYTYVWANGETKSEIGNLYADVFSVEVVDAKHCGATQKIEIKQPEQPLIIEASPKNVSCLGYKDGIIDIFVYGGAAPYTFKWSNGKTDEDIFNLSSGDYTIKITDSKNCTKEKTFTVSAPLEELKSEIKKVEISCANKNDGKIELITTGGEKPYKYKWSTDSELKIIENLKQGTYNVDITDNFGCTITKVINLIEPKELSIIENIINTNSGNDGEISIEVFGGTKPYIYTWDSGETTSNIQKLSKGEYKLTIKDANNCILINDFTVK